MQEKEIVYCFDFDGTLTHTDTLLAFIVHARGRARMVLGFALYSPLLVLMKLRLLNNGKVKQKIFSLFFKGTRVKRFNELCADFAKTHTHLWRTPGREAVAAALQQQKRVLVVSASVENWVSAFFSRAQLYGVEVLGTRIEVVDGKLTGRFETPNCYGKEKVRRIENALCNLPRTHYYIKAYGDSRGDDAMFDYADEVHYKPFR